MAQYIATITFSEPVIGFTSADLTIPHATITQALASADGGITWTVGITPNANTYAPTNVITLDMTGVTDVAGNAGLGVVTSANYVVNTDTVKPTCISIAISSYNLV
jgi:Bacterial Ig-like domain